jgi:superfamily II DNA or RNA helicase
MLYTVDAIRQNFDSGTYNRGAEYHRRRKVLQVAIDGDVIKGLVSGSDNGSYRQTIKLSMKGQQQRFKGDCSCPMDYNCKHVVAVLLAALDSMPKPAQAPVLPADFLRWLTEFSYVTDTARRKQAARLVDADAKAQYRLIYVLIPDRFSACLQLHLCKGRVVAGGAIRTCAPVSELESFRRLPPAYVRDEDLGPVRDFVSILENSWQPVMHLDGPGAAQLITQLLDLGVLYRADDKAGLRSGLQKMEDGPARQGAMKWRAEKGQGGLRLRWQFDDKDAVIEHVLPSQPSFYVDGNRVGPLQLHGLPALPGLKDLITMAARAPLLPVDLAPLLVRELLSPALNGLLPLPEQATTRRTGVRPKPLLTLGSVPRSGLRGGGQEPVDYAMLDFDYDGLRLSTTAKGELASPAGTGIEIIERHHEDEKAALSALHAAGFRAADPDGQHDRLYLPSQHDWLLFAGEGLAGLRAQGWHIELTPEYRFDLAAIDDWYAQVAQDHAETGSPWLELELGIVVQGASVPLLPVLLQLIREAPRDFERGALELRRDDELLLASLPDGRRTALPWGRIKPILRTLGELYFSDHVGDTLMLPALDAARLAELEASAQLRWMGGEQLLALGRKLNAFERIQPVAPPVGLQASLRPYQAEGVAWMQFLREYGLAGILADDMGLGKTIQTLSHILLEKEAGRLGEPALVVAPTSLMPNWQEEAARFAPGLRVLVLTGNDRLQRFDQIGEADLVLTSYALLPRDEEALLRHSFHLLILDESQYIKNHRAKAAQTASLLRARHRLCLTGTPMQNHLGELWSQFHFLMPGLLGDEKAFNANFRKPIEKQGDGERNAFLIRRIKPFLLRRTKDSVAKELPPKTEMVRLVDLAGAQRDLYETVRLAMDRKVREEIALKGVARSQIVILDALLKLRQVCCDPRLLKAAETRKAGAPSAKLEALLELMEELLAEGRKVLVFSQFTSMLALIEAELQARAVPYALLTGDTKDRASVVNAFQQGAAPVFLISLKAGGVGLNLTAADTVIHYDPWWNPAAENQATDRAWRIGQDKPVFVYRLIARGTLEEKIQELQRTKAALADAVLAGGETQGLQITAEDLLGILGPG